MVTSTYRVDAELKQQAAALYESMGMSLNTAINVFLRQSVKERRMPFQPSAAPMAEATAEGESARTLPQPGTGTVDGIVFQGLDDRGYPVLTIPERLVLQPKHDEDGTPVLPQSWKD